MKSKTLTTERSGNNIQSLERAIEILRLLSLHTSGLALGDIAERLTLNSSTVHHLLATMKQQGFIDQDPETKAYHLGYGIISLVSRYLRSIDLYTAALGPIRKLRDLTEETSYLTILHGRDLITLIEMVGTRPVQARRPTLPGQSTLHSTASGKTLLAYLPPDRAEEILSALELTRYTDNTITSLADLQVELERIRRHGIGLDYEENLPGVSCIAAPVFDSYGQCIGTASIAFATKAIPNQGWHRLVELVRRCGAEISEKLGYVPDTENTSDVAGSES